MSHSSVYQMMLLIKQEINALHSVHTNWIFLVGSIIFDRTVPACVDVWSNGFFYLNQVYGVSMNRQQAELINQHAEKLIYSANHILYVANNSGDDELKFRVQHALALVVNEVDFKILEPLYKSFPDLRPDQLKSECFTSSLI